MVPGMSSLLRRLARKHDPISPQAVSIYKGKLFAFAGTPCANFKATQDKLSDEYFDELEAEGQHFFSLIII